MKPLSKLTATLFIFCILTLMLYLISAYVPRFVPQLLPGLSLFGVAGLAVAAAISAVNDLYDLISKLRQKPSSQSDETASGDASSSIVGDNQVTVGDINNSTNINIASGNIDVHYQVSDYAQREFNLWKLGTLREINLELELREWEESRRETPEHFRVIVELQSVVHEKRSIILGGRDDFWETGSGGWYFGTKTLFWRQAFPHNEPVWIPQKGGRVGGGIVKALRFGVKWYPRSPVLITEFEHLNFHLHVTENLTDRLASARLTLDSYIVYDHKIESVVWEIARPNFDWPDILTPEEAKLEWRWCHAIRAELQLEHVPPTTS